jgi:hypothetical protein
MYYCHHSLCPVSCRGSTREQPETYVADHHIHTGKISLSHIFMFFGNYCDHHEGTFTRILILMQQITHILVKVP